MFAKFMIRIF